MMNPARVLKRVVRSGVLQPILAANLLLLPCTPCALSQGPRNTPPTGVEDPYVILLENQQALAKQNDQLRRQLAQMELLLKGMIEFQATIAAPKEAREAKAKEDPIPT